LTNAHPAGTDGHHEVTVVEAGRFARTAEPAEREMLRRQHADLSHPGCVLLYTP
jgi:hypothetical protein